MAYIDSIRVGSGSVYDIHDKESAQEIEKIWQALNNGGGSGGGESGTSVISVNYNPYTQTLFFNQTGYALNLVSEYNSSTKTLVLKYE